MSDSNKLLARRNFLKVGGIVAVSAPFVALKQIVDITKERKEPLEIIQEGQILTAKHYAEVVTRINDLELRQ